MITTQKPQLSLFGPAEARTATKNVLNCYEILNSREFSWPVNVYRVEFADRSKQTHESRGEAKDIIWKLRLNELKSQWRGWGFVVDLNQYDVAVPQAWSLAKPIRTAEYSVTLARSFTATVGDAEGRAVVAGVLRDKIKEHFKGKPAPELGELWQDFDSFCQYPGSDWGKEFLMCRRFSVSVKQLTGAQLVLQTNVGPELCTQRASRAVVPFG
jgi:hypothetical protein